MITGPHTGWPKTIVLWAAVVAVLASAPARAAAPARDTAATTATPSRGFSARSLVSQADADLAAGRPGPAIVGYERARLLAPRAPAIAAGLSRARAMTGVPSPEAAWPARLSADQWGWIGLTGLIVIAAGLVAWSWGLLRRGGLAGLAVAGVVLTGLGFGAAVEVTPPPNRAVVIVPDAIARIAPFAKADEAFAAPEGALVTVERTYQGYALVTGAEGQGWLPRNGLAIILPEGGSHG